MSATLDYDMKKALPFLTKDNRWNVLTVLILHANVRNRCWPSIKTIAKFATNGNRNRATRAKNWLLKHGAFTMVANDKRVDEETPLNGRQLIYQLTGVLKACEDAKCQCKGFAESIHYLYKAPVNGDVGSIQPDTSREGRSIQPDTTHSMNGDTMRSMNGDTRSIPNEVFPKEVAGAQKSRRSHDLEFDVIAEVWENSAGGWVSNMQGMMFGSKAVRGEWLKCFFKPEATIEEVRSFGVWAKRNPANNGKMPTRPDTIQRQFYEFRTVQSKKLIFDNADYIPVDERTSVLDGIKLA